jgi:hypothetical protein
MSESVVQSKLVCVERLTYVLLSRVTCLERSISTRITAALFYSDPYCTPFHPHSSLSPIRAAILIGPFTHRSRNLLSTVILVGCRWYVSYHGAATTAPHPTPGATRAGAARSGATSPSPVPPPAAPAAHGHDPGAAAADDAAGCAVLDHDAGGGRGCG